MRILVLIHEYPPVGGGGGRAARDICEGLARRGHELHVLTARCGDLPAVEGDGGLVVERLASLRREMFRAGLVPMGAYVAAAVLRGLQVAHRWKPDVIHAHFAVPGGAAAWLLGLLTGIPYVLTAHLGDVPGGVPEKTGNWFRWIFPFTPPIWRKAKKVAAVSEFTRGLALKHYPVPVEVIPNGVDLQALDPGEMRLNDPPGVVFAGRFMPQKNPLQIVRSLAQVAELPWHCRLIGDGPLRPQVEQEIQALGLEERFSLTGWVEPEKVLALYKQSDIYFMPSLSEGLPVAGVQALALGLALVLSEAGGNPELVQAGENGFLVPPGKPEEYAAALWLLLNDRERLLAARQASRRLATRFDLGQVVAAYEALLGAGGQTLAGRGAA